MVSASVGFQCPECVREGNASVREAKTVFGAAAGEKPPVVTRVLIALSVIGYGLQLAVPELTNRFDTFGVAVAFGEWWRLFTSGFLHGGLMHLAFNMWALFVVGQQLERQLGWARYLALYLVCLLGGSTVSYFFSSPESSSVGASGAIFGLFGGLFVVARRMNWELNGVIGIVVINFAIPFFVPNIDWRAHVGGLVTGLLVTSVFAYAPVRFRTIAPVLAIGLVTLTCGAIVAAHSHAIQQIPELSTLGTTHVDRTTAV